jgi:hypothetical protein
VPKAVPRVAWGAMAPGGPVTMPFSKYKKVLLLVPLLAILLVKQLQTSTSDCVRSDRLDSLKGVANGHWDRLLNAHLADKSPHAFGNLEHSLLFDCINTSARALENVSGDWTSTVSKFSRHTTPNF